MLRINLLPVRQLRKRAKARNQIICVLAGLVALILLMGFYGYLQSQRISSYQKNISSLNRDKAKYQPILAQMRKIEQTKKELERKTSVINSLKAESSITVRVLDAVARTIDNDRMWLLSLTQHGASLQLQGIALDNQTIAEFMDNLKASPLIEQVDLTDSSLRKYAGQNLKSFSLHCTIVLPKVEQIDKKKKR